MLQMLKLGEELIVVLVGADPEPNETLLSESQLPDSPS